MRRQESKVQVSLKLSISGQPFELSASVPAGPTTPRRMLPVFRSLCGKIVREAVEGVANAGREISCTAGCGACCRQMVPISTTEAIHIRRLVEGMEPERQATIRQRFADAVSKLASAGMLDRLRRDPQPTGSEYHELGIEYFHLGIPCPFLEDESCSIHPERPLVCREYLVVSPAENCTRTNGRPVEVVGLPIEASKALNQLGKKGKWLPLTLSLEHDEDEPMPTTGTKIATQFFSNLIGRNLGK